MGEAVNTFFTIAIIGTFSVMAFMIAWIMIDAKLNWNGDYRMDAAEKGTRRCIKMNPFLERYFVEQGLL